jgi:hypothetical protein
MLYSFPVGIGVFTDKVDAYHVPLEMTAGKITRVMVQFPAGHLGLTHLIILDGLHQLWPSNEGEDFSTSDETITWLEDYDLTEPPYTLTAWGWNEDDTYDHTITVRIELEPANVETSLADQIKQLLGIGGA